MNALSLLISCRRVCSITRRVSSETAAYRHKVTAGERHRLLEPDPRLFINADPVRRAEIMAAHQREARASEA